MITEKKIKKGLLDKNFKKVAVFGYKNKNDLGDFIIEIKTNLKEDKLKEYFLNKFKGKYEFFSFSWDNGEKPNFIKAINKEVLK